MANLLRTVCMVLLFLLTTLAAPLQFPLLQPLPGTWQQQQLAVQEQMLALQQFQALQQMNSLPSPMTLNPQQPLLVLVPNTPSKSNKNEYTKHENHVTKGEPDKVKEDEDTDSITIEADTQEGNDASDESPMRAFLLVPNRARFSIGGIISTIPWLPIEINVPDSISWIYQGISSIISGIGQRWPFNRPQTNEGQSHNMATKMSLKNSNKKKVMPIVVMPLSQHLPVVPNMF